jgi:DNA-binding NtrC family response regulator
MPPFLPDCTAHAAITRAPRQIRRASTRGPASASAIANAADACGMVGSSAAMQALFCQIRKVAAAEVPVLLLGASGTGKELAARALHHQSTRRERPFVAVNCGAIVPHLLQSELFGHERGAFTGATQRRIGRIEAAHGGTLMLDEIGDMPLEMQVNLLRFLQEQTIERVGSSSTMAVNVRVIAATHVDLAEAVHQRRFREDLYYRINVVCIGMPALAARGQDIETIAEHYFTRFAPAHNRSLRGFSRDAIQAMLAHPWPGNVRELVNRVQRAVIMADGRFIQPHDLGLTLPECETELPTLAAGRAAAERVLIRRALSHSGNQVARAAALLGVSRVTLYRLIDKHCLDTHAEATVGNVQLAANDGCPPPD